MNNQTTSVTQNVEQHFREAVRTIPTTEADFRADGTLTWKAFKRITNQAMDIVCAADLEEAERTGRFPAADMQAEALRVYRLVDEEINAKTRAAGAAK